MVVSPINIILCVDKNVLIPTSTLINSVYFHCINKERLHFYIITDCSDLYKNILTSHCLLDQSQINYINPYDIISSISDFSKKIKVINNQRISNLFNLVT